jgi:hypothetical protein
LQGAHAKYNSDRIRERLDQQQQYALFIYLTTNDSTSMIIDHLRSHFRKDFKGITIEDLEEKIAKISFKLDSPKDPSQRLELTAEQLRGIGKSQTLGKVSMGAQRRTAQSIFEVTLEARNNGLKLKEISKNIGRNDASTYLAFIDYLQKTITPSRQYLLALSMEGMLTPRQCVAAANEKFSLIASGNALTEGVLDGMLRPESKVSKFVKKISKGKMPSLRELRQVLMRDSDSK